MSNPTDPAFPTKSDGTNTGLTKREYLSGEALKGLISNPESSQANKTDLANLAVVLADALLASLAA